jgi:hypothetical protein
MKEEVQFLRRRGRVGDALNDSPHLYQGSDKGRVPFETGRHSRNSFDVGSDFVESPARVASFAMISVDEHQSLARCR